ncbi:MAG TPA: alpha/beta hydrolase [Syntrophobacteraceae bacterium]|nr:alpha/beta hydrolase [Syntrophobacteraceae bacterium]
MPVIAYSDYHPPWFLRNGHVQSIVPILCRRVNGVEYKRQRLDTPDDDFLDLDFSLVGADRIAVVSHGLEGSSDRPYVRGMVRALNRSGWDAVAWNFRGCSGEPNRQLRFYHSGDTEDLHTVVSHILAEGHHSLIALIGFSLGGNITLKYLGERGVTVDPRITAAVALSVPCDLTTAAVTMSSSCNTVYMKRFLRMLHLKIQWKMQQFPGAIDDRDFQGIRTFHHFDERYTAPMHGFQSAVDYYEKASSLPFLARISIPTLLVNAADDPFLSPSCYPRDVARNQANLFLEVPAFGGHVGFMNWSADGEYWSERRATEFLRNWVDQRP